MASNVYYAVDEPERIAFVRFIPDVAQSSQVFAAFTTRNGAFMTLCKYDDGRWKVWGLGTHMIGARSVLVEEPST